MPQKVKGDITVGRALPFLRAIGACHTQLAFIATWPDETPCWEVWRQLDDDAIAWMLETIYIGDDWPEQTMHQSNLAHLASLRDIAIGAAFDTWAFEHVAALDQENEPDRMAALRLANEKRVAAVNPVWEAYYAGLDAEERRSRADHRSLRQYRSALLRFKAMMGHE
jgi:hypothetical protein